MIDDAGAAPAAAEPVMPSQDAGAFAQSEAEAASDRSKETARASIDRAFAEIDAATGGERDDPQPAASQTPEAQKAGKAGTDKPAADKAAVALGEPPARFSADAKAAWASVPDSIRGEVNRAFREMEGGLNQYQRFFEPLKPFYQLAEKNDTTVEDALSRYVSLDSELTSDDPARRLSAIQEVLEYAGLSPGEYAAQVTDQKAVEPQPQSNPEIRQLKGELAEMRRLLGGVSTTLRQSRESRLEGEIGAVVEEFAGDHPRLNEAEFARTVTRLISTQMADDLAGAYDMAERLIPAPLDHDEFGSNRSKLINAIAANKPKPADQTRKGQLSIAGAPVSGSNPVNRKPAATARESLDRVFADMGFSG
jgi:hypothetical protein